MTASETPREPRVFAPDDPAILVPAEALAVEDAEHEPLLGARHNRGIGWGGLLVSAVAGMVLLSLSLSFGRFVSTTLERQDWIGWLAAGLVGVAALAAAVILFREVLGLLRLRRLTRLRKEAEKSLLTQDQALERSSLSKLRALYRGRRDMRWALARLREHERDVRDPGELLKLADRELLVPLDGQARRLILASAKRVSVVTAISPIFWVAMLYVGAENLRMLRALAGLYGGRPGAVGALRLARLVIAHIVATGGLALTDDLLGQFLGQDLVRRLSRRLGEGVFNGALTARIGAAAVEVTRPLPFLEADPIRVRDLLPELFRRRAAERADGPR